MKYALAKVKTYIQRIDKILLLLVCAISGFAVYLLYTLYQNEISPSVSSGQYLTQLIAAVAGLVVALVIAAINYKFIAKLWFIYAPVALIMTALLFTSLGVQNEGADDIGWLNLGFIQFQPSELLKLAFILSFAFHLSKVEDRMNEPIHFILLCIHGGVPTLLIVMTGDDGSAMVFLFVFLCMIFAAGLSWKYLLFFGAVTPVGIYVLWNYIMQPHQQQRFQVLWDTAMQEEEALGIYMQQRLGKIALGSGGLTGQGLSGGHYTYVPEIHNDFIFSYIGMTMGLLGCLLVIGLLAALSLKILSSASAAKDLLGRSICVGVFALILFHSVINIGMVLGVAPVIGIPLPFFSAGGTSVACLFVAIGLVLSVGVHNTKKYHMFYTELDD
ncbi:MAG: FtsW/RodA/SpoVE family cell cycle protein [Ruminiclostridium sp.]|nr:FtsW/RodA/SpoVE family cell cycle protein [Ruminiclostridium sp.]